MPTILIVDDEASARWVLKKILERDGYTTVEAEGYESALRALAEQPCDLVLLDLRLPEDLPHSGFDILKEVKQGPALPVIVVSGLTDLEDLKEAMRLGAYDYVFKPVSPEILLPLVRSALEQEALRSEVKSLRAEIEASYGLSALIGQSPAMQKIKAMLPVVARTQAPVLLTGPSGTGKDHLARTIHHLSERRRGPFIALNCGAIPKELVESELFGHEKGAFTGAVREKRGVFELAHKGTVFLDEIGEMPPEAQVRLLRVLEGMSFRRVGGEKEIRVDTRLIAATNRDLPKKIQEGAFREDLFFRLNVVSIHIPPLAERREDIPLLIAHFLRLFGRREDAIDRPTLEALTRYPWPGNVRELKNAIERALIFAGDRPLTLEDFRLEAPSLRQPLPSPSLDDALARLKAAVLTAGRSGSLPPIFLKEVERTLLEAALEAARYNKSEAARLLGMERKSLERRARKYQLA